MVLELALVAIAGFLVLAIGAVGLSRSRAATPIVYGASLLLSLLVLVPALIALLTRAPAVSIVLPLGLPWIGAHFRLDALAALFLIVVSLGGATASLYALGYGRHEEAPHRVLPFYPLFLAGMTLVVLADDAFSFLLCWEVMSLASWALVMAHHREADNARAGYIYIVMASFGTLALLLAFGLLAGPEGAYAFAQMRSAAHGPALAALVLVLALLGSGSKAGLVPLHVWLPLAHPAAPSHVSGLMSGVMTKVAVYAFIRIVFDLLDAPSWWASMIVLTLCRGDRAPRRAVRADAARSQTPARLSHGREYRHHLHRLGSCTRLSRRGMNAAAALALIAALFHVLNHSLFKSLLFFGAGAVLTANRRARHGEAWRPDPQACRWRALRFSSAASRSRRCRRSTASSRNG